MQKTVQVVIEIDKELTEKGHWYTDEEMWAVIKAAQNGTVLQPHGQLIDVDNIQEIELEDSLHILTHKKGDEVDWYIDAPTILEAWGNEE